MYVVAVIDTVPDVAMPGHHGECVGRREDDDQPKAQHDSRPPRRRRRQVASHRHRVSPHDHGASRSIAQPLPLQTRRESKTGFVRLPGRHLFMREDTRVVAREGGSPALEPPPGGRVTPSPMASR
jgi:hypothetical protein